MTTAPRQRSANYQGPRWRAVEVDAAALRQARPRPLTTQAEPEGSPTPARQVSEVELRKAVQDVVEKHPKGSPPLDEESLHKQVESWLGTTVARDRVRQAQHDVAPEFKLPPGRPRKSAQ